MTASGRVSFQAPRLTRGERLLDPQLREREALVIQRTKFGRGLAPSHCVKQRVGKLGSRRSWSRSVAQQRKPMLPARSVIAAAATPVFSVFVVIAHPSVCYSTHHTARRALSASWVVIIRTVGLYCLQHPTLRARNTIAMRLSFKLPFQFVRLLACLYGATGKRVGLCRFLSHTDFERRRHQFATNSCPTRRAGDTRRCRDCGVGARRKQVWQ